MAGALALAFPLFAQAQATSMPASALRYQSAFADYKPWQDIKPGNWRALNDVVRDAPGGMAGMTVPVASAAAASAPAAAASATPKASRHEHAAPGGKP